MTWFGTDVMALGCIVGSALAGGAATFAVLDRGGDGHVSCAVETSVASSRISILHGGEARAIVVRPDVRVRTLPDCMADARADFEIHMDSHLGQLEHLDQVLELQLQGLESQIEAQVEQELKARVQLEEAVRQMERARARVVAEKGGTGSN